MDIKELVEILNFSNIGWQILTPVIFSLFDIITGVIQAIINHDLDSTKMRSGLLHKVLIIIVILMSFIIDITFSLNFVSKVVCIYVIFMECTSILENLKKAGIEIGSLTEIIKNKEETKNETKQR